LYPSASGGKRGRSPEKKRRANPALCACRGGNQWPVLLVPVLLPEVSVAPVAEVPVPAPLELEVPPLVVPPELTLFELVPVAPLLVEPAPELPADMLELSPVPPLPVPVELQAAKLRAIRPPMRMLW
jgi:hypothetical protein